MVGGGGTEEGGALEGGAQTVVGGSQWSSLLCMFATFQPDTQLSILFLPMITFSAGLGIRMMMVADCAGMVLRWRYLDHAAHLGGMLFGVAWAHWGASSVWAGREGLVTAWHNLRNRNK